MSAPSISAAVFPDVAGVIGLSDLVVAQGSVARASVVRDVHRSGRLAPHQATAGPTPCAAASVANQYGSLTADQLASYYGFDPLYSSGDLGQGVNVALVEFEPDLATDIAAYQACYGTDATVNYIPVDGGAGSGAGTGEAALDIENVIGLAPEATVDVYQQPNGGTQSTWEAYSAVVNADADQVVSTSWGLCEPEEGQMSVLEYALLEQAATQGQTVFAVAGDAGSTACYSGTDTTNGATPSVLEPASGPYVIAVGGTSIGAGSESVWNDSSESEGAGGGGVSAFWCMPSYQYQPKIPGLISSYSVSDTTDCGSGNPPYMREVPDVSADADPTSGYAIYWNGSWSYAIGGTSAAAPLWAAAGALIDSSLFCTDYGSGAAGVLPQGLYLTASSGSSYYALAFHDITTGNNDYTPSGYSGGLYPATVGYDMASGLGSPILAHAGQLPPRARRSGVLPDWNGTQDDRNHRCLAEQGPEHRADLGDHHRLGLPPNCRSGQARGRYNVDHRFLHDHR